MSYKVVVRLLGGTVLALAVGSMPASAAATDVWRQPTPGVLELSRRTRDLRVRAVVISISAAHGDRGGESVAAGFARHVLHEFSRHADDVATDVLASGCVTALGATPDQRSVVLIEVAAPRNVRGQPLALRLAAQFRTFGIARAVPLDVTSFAHIARSGTNCALRENAVSVPPASLWQRIVERTSSAVESANARSRIVANGPPNTRRGAQRSAASRFRAARFEGFAADDPPNAEIRFSPRRRRLQAIASTASTVKYPRTLAQIPR